MRSAPGGCPLACASTWHSPSCGSGSRAPPWPNCVALRRRCSAPPTTRCSWSLRPSTSSTASGSNRRRPRRHHRRPTSGRACGGRCRRPRRAGRWAPCWSPSPDSACGWRRSSTRRCRHCRPPPSTCPSPTRRRRMRGVRLMPIRRFRPLRRCRRHRNPSTGGLPCRRWPCRRWRRCWSSSVHAPRRPNGSAARRRGGRRAAASPARRPSRCSRRRRPRGSTAAISKTRRRCSAAPSRRVSRARVWTSRAPCA